MHNNLMKKSLELWNMKRQNMDGTIPPSPCLMHCIVKNVLSASGRLFTGGVFFLAAALAHPPSKGRRLPLQLGRWIPRQPSNQLKIMLSTIWYTSFMASEAYATSDPSWQGRARCDRYRNMRRAKRRRIQYDLCECVSLFFKVFSM